MKELILLYWGTVFLMYLSQYYYAVPTHLEGGHIGRRSFMWRKSDIFMVIVIAWLTCFSFLRTSYNDTWNYRELWTRADRIDVFLAEGGLWDLTGNPLSYLWESLSKSICENYHVYFFPPALMSSFAVVKLCKRYSLNPAFSMLIFFSIGTYVMYIAALKQCFAIFFLLIALPYAIDKKYVRFYILVFVAILFHTHAFLFAIVPFLRWKPWGKITWIMLGVVVFAMVTYDVTLGAFMRYAQSIGALVDEGEVFDGHQIHIIRVFVYWVPALIALCFRRRLFRDSTPVENLFVNMSMVGAFILTMGTVQAANLFARMAGYFELATAIAIPWMIKKLFTKQSAQLVTVMASALYFGYFLYEFAVSKDFGADYAAISLWEFFLELLR